MSFFCWKCQGEISHSENAVDDAALNRMQTIKDHDQTRIQIVPWATVSGRYEIRREVGYSGTYDVRPFRDGCIDYEKNIFVRKDEDAEVAPELELKPFGDLKVSSEPSGAAVYLDGKEVGQTPLSLTGVLVGKRELELRLANYESTTQIIIVEPAMTLQLPLVILPPVAAWTEPSTGMEFVWVPGGCFEMGSNAGNNDETPVHKVCVDGFWMGKYEVTQGQWQKIMGNDPARFKKGSDYPVEYVSWEDCQLFIGKLNGQSGKTFRLPTEAEWEYACRSGGRDEQYAGGDDCDQVAWYRSNSSSSTHAVGGKAANGLGLYDMSGNVWEWCLDWYADNYYSSSPTDNPQGPLSGSLRVNRGGSWDYYSWGLRSSYRSRYLPSSRYISLGFRLVLPGPRRSAVKWSNSDQWNQWHLMWAQWGQTRLKKSGDRIYS